MRAYFAAAACTALAAMVAGCSLPNQRAAAFAPGPDGVYGAGIKLYGVPDELSGLVFIGPVSEARAPVHGGRRSYRTPGDTQPAFARDSTHVRALEIEGARALQVAWTGPRSLDVCAPAPAVTPPVTTAELDVNGRREVFTLRARCPLGPEAVGIVYRGES